MYRKQFWYKSISFGDMRDFNPDPFCPICVQSHTKFQSKVLERCSPLAPYFTDLYARIIIEKNIYYGEPWNLQYICIGVRRKIDLSWKIAVFIFKIQKSKMAAVWSSFAWKSTQKKW